MELKIDNWESFLYESRPFAYVAIGTYALAADKPNLILLAAAAILIFCGILVLRMRFNARAGATMESLYYESLPFLYLGIGVYALFFLNFTKIAVGSGVILLFCATKVFQWRILNRRAVFRVVRNKPTPEKKKAESRPASRPLV